VDLAKEDVLVHGLSHDEVSQAMQCIRDEIHDTTITLHKRSAAFLRSRTWKQFLVEVVDEYKLADVLVSECTITVTAVNQVISLS